MRQASLNLPRVLQEFLSLGRTVNERGGSMCIRPSGQIATEAIKQFLKFFQREGRNRHDTSKFLAFRQLERQQVP